jgi:hypothetical protein
MIEDRTEALQCRLLHVVTNWFRELRSLTAH